ncbi:MAG: hypothetical protein ACT4PP_09265 [Sporichthyaceae bacterium]
MTDRTSRALLAGALGVGLFAVVSPNAEAESAPVRMVPEHAPYLSGPGTTGSEEVSDAAPTALSPAPAEVTMAPAGIPLRSDSGAMDAETTLLLGMIAGIVLAGVGMFGVVPTPARTRSRRVPLSGQG